MTKNTHQRAPCTTAVFVTFESEFAPLGGLAAVMRVLPKRMAEIQQGGCFLLAPFFREITKCRPQIYTQIRSTGIQFQIAFGKKPEKVEVFQHQDEKGFKTFLLDSPSFFNSPCDCGDPPHPKTPCNPYLDPSKPNQLLQDALFFCKALPEALVGLGYTKDLVLYLQDWETACIALTSKENKGIHSSRCLLTLHNPYDKLLTKKDFSKISRRILRGPTVLSKIIPLLDGPLSTVSQHFAGELLHDPLHTLVYAPHLQRAFKKRHIVGINNGLFGHIDFPRKALDAADQGDFKAILREKTKRRNELNRVLRDYQPAQAWGNVDLANFDGPIFLLFGRDDPRQKGYDVAAAAIEKIPRGKAKYIFTPIPGDEGLVGLEFLKTLTKHRPGEVKVFPFRMKRGYMDLQKGASFLVMCSLYEPFGGATEGYVVGTPVVARATGGLVQQICPYPSRSLTDAVKLIAKPYHHTFHTPTGLLYREPVLKRKDQIAGWRKIVECGYWPGGDRMADRKGTLLFDAMVDQAVQAITDAIDLYRHDKVAYATMIRNGLKMLERFSWDFTAQQYQNLVHWKSK